MPGMQTRQVRYDAVVIGSGQASESLAIEFARAGFNTALLDQFASGCSCVESGCPSSISLIASANVARLARRASDFGVRTGRVVVDFGKVQMRRHAVIEGLRNQAMQTLRDTPGLTTLQGDVRFESAESLLVSAKDGGVVAVQGQRIFINTGSRPALPDLPGLGEVPYLTSSSAMELDELPDHLLVVGGSYLGVELGQMFRRFGCRVSIVERQSQLLAREDRDIAASVAEILRDDGVEVFLETEAIGIANDAAGGIRLKVKIPSGEHMLSGSHLLVAAGREPVTDGLNLAAAGIAVDAHGYINVNERLETSAPGVYALGGVNGGPAFTHVAYDELRIIRANLLEHIQLGATERMYPYRAFIDPQLGRIGLTESHARNEGRTVRVAKLPMNRVGRSVELNEPRGLMKVVVDSSTHRILGAAALGVGSGEIMAMLQIAMMANIPYTSLRDGMFVHPLAGSLNTLFATLDG
ncbi:MAG: mercuric reductase [Prolixibacteraceae bacterium]|nr:mercuric reductase [Burkholderiales bacterium]